MSVRLETIAPDLVESLGTRSEALLRKIAAAITGITCRETGLSDPRLDRAVAALRNGPYGDSETRSGVEQLVDELDERAWALQEGADRDPHAREEYLAAFSLARAASTAWAALDSEPVTAAVEAIYEAQAATGDLAMIRREVDGYLEARNESDTNEP